MTEETAVSSSPILIGNDGSKIKSTNYWLTQYAIEGLCYMSGNAGDWRLLIPQKFQEAIDEFRTVKRASIERSIVIKGHFDIIAEDGSQNPYCISIDRKMFDRTPMNKRCRLLVCSDVGLIKNIPVQVRL